MHELGLVFALSDLLEEVAAVAGPLPHLPRYGGAGRGVRRGGRAAAGRVGLGAAQKSDLLRGCQLELREVPAVTVCNACGRTYATVPQGRICPCCASPDTQLLRGNEFEVLEVEGM